MNYNFPAISIIISTYNQPIVLRLVLLALGEQNSKNFEVIVADDGSDVATKKTIELLQAEVDYRIKHVWQERSGFRAAMIRNKGVAVASGDYLIFLDGDSIPQVSFVKRHQALAEKGYFVAGNRILLSKNFTNLVLAESLAIHKWKIWQWFYAFCLGRINRFLPVISLGNLDWRYLYRTKWQGAKTCNLGMWKQDFFAVNGLDEKYCGWGYEDSDLVIRLIRNKVWRKDGRFALPVCHLWHLENSREQEQNNYQKLQAIIESSMVKAQQGVDQYVNV